MSKNRREFLLSASAGAAGLGLALPASVTPVSAQAATLLFGTTNTPQIPVNVLVMHPWAKRINEQGKGIVTIDVRDGPTFANFMNYYDRVIADAVQISWGIQSLVAGKFIGSLAPSLPFTSDLAEPASVAYWRLLKSGQLDNEYADIVPLFVCVFSQASLHTRRPLQKPDDIANLKIATGSRIISDVIARLNGTPISIPLSDTYEALQRGTVDGIVTPWTAILPFKLYEVLRYHVDTELGSNVGAVFMSKKRFAELAPAAQKVIMDNSVEPESRHFGAFWDSENNRGREAVRAMPDHTLVTLSPEQSAGLRERLQPVRQAWAQSTPKGAAILRTYEQLLADVRAGR
jgi:TRAP-type C4-dicarboxylate transport system substrate-binding protein